MERGLLCVLVLLLKLWDASGQDGEYCHGWVDSSQLWHKGFQCPERYDIPEATLCCGTCSLRYCCSSREARLDQGLCPNDHEQSSSMPPSVPMYLPFLLVGSVFVAFVVIGILIGLCCCRCLKSQDEEQQNGPAPIQSRLLEADPPSRLSSSSSSSATRVSLGGHTQTNNICMSMAPPFPIIGCSQFLPPPSTSGLLQAPCINYGIPTDHTAVMTPAPFLNRTVHGQTSNSYSLSAMHDDGRMCSGVYI
ncbi:PREDICTED: protein shisa-1-like [Gavialis gangeticus]|uniref:protein shisa-1-like n=1 Tax=Gavialis gangeticus TaxID=94835 RepID=UPI00092F2DDE|nr:PREDICTED: protein shisa-1-like [Gavialis gangeticus]